MTYHTAWILHCRAYKENSAIADVLTQSHGKISVIVPAHLKKKNPFSFQPFIKLKIGWTGKNSLKKMIHIEVEHAFRLKNKYLFSAFYINELLVKSLQPLMHIDGLIELYDWAIQGLYFKKKPLEFYLRIFEKYLLIFLGYAIPLTTEAYSSTPVHAEKKYFYHPHEGFMLTNQNQSLLSFPGWVLLNYDKNIIKESMLGDLKKLNRQAINHLLKGKKLETRSLFSSTINSKK